MREDVKAQLHRLRSSVQEVPSRGKGCHTCCTLPFGFLLFLCCYFFLWTQMSSFGANCGQISYQNVGMKQTTLRWPLCSCHVMYRITMHHPLLYGPMLNPHFPSAPASVARRYRFTSSSYDITDITTPSEHRSWKAIALGLVTNATRPEAIPIRLELLGFFCVQVVHVVLWILKDEFNRTFQMSLGPAGALLGPPLPGYARLRVRRWEETTLGRGLGWE